MSGVRPAELEAVTARAWRAAEESAIGGWRLNASAGFSGRINACWPMASPGLEAVDAIGRVEAWYGARGLRPRFKLAGGDWTPPDLPSHLARAGYGPGSETLVMTGATHTSRTSPAILLGSEPQPGFLEVFLGTSADPGDAEERLEALRRTPSPRAFALARRDAAPAAIGACAIEPPWVGVFAMRTVPAARRRGLAQAILGTLLAEGAAQGATTAWLQVEAANAGAVSLYQRAGFAEAYRYTYWMKAPG